MKYRIYILDARPGIDRPEVTEHPVRVISREKLEGCLWWCPKYGRELEKPESIPDTGESFHFEIEQGYWADYRHVRWEPA